MGQLASLVAFAAVVVVAPLRAQAVIQTPKATIEIIGLSRWTMKMVEDSLAKYGQDSLTAHACAAILRQKLHFADASVSVFTNFPEYKFKNYVAITVVEPQDSARIRYKPELRDSLPVRAEWAEAYAAFNANYEQAEHALQTLSFYQATVSSADSARFAKVELLHRLIVTKHDAAELASAIHTLDTDASVANRVMAVFVLSTFTDHDVAWWTLMDAQRDPTGIVSGMSSTALTMMSRRAPRTVDWRPMADRLRYLIDGTNLFAFGPTLAVLDATNVDRSLASTLLRDGATIIRARLRSGDVLGKRQAVSFLSKLSGLPATSSDADFLKWLDDLNADRRGT
ncbi:MAG TPA: hypothetical protein VH559_00290 [Gemmatimonadaceae bacterium]|jgi:hypothetical protein